MKYLAYFILSGFAFLVLVGAIGVALVLYNWTYEGIARAREQRRRDRMLLAAIYGRWFK